MSSINEPSNFSPHSELNNPFAESVSDQVRLSLQAIVTSNKKIQTVSDSGFNTFSFSRGPEWRYLRGMIASSQLDRYSNIFFGETEWQRYPNKDNTSRNIPRVMGYNLNEYNHVHAGGAVDLAYRAINDQSELISVGSKLLPTVLPEEVSMFVGNVSFWRSFGQYLGMRLPTRSELLKTYACMQGESMHEKMQYAGLPYIGYFNSVTPEVPKSTIGNMIHLLAFEPKDDEYYFMIIDRRQQKPSLIRFTPDSEYFNYGVSAILVQDR